MGTSIVVSQVLLDSLYVAVIGLAFFASGVAALRDEKLHGLREANITSDGDRPTGGEAFGARASGGILATLGLSLTWLGANNLAADVSVNVAFGTVTFWLGLVTLHDWRVPGLRGFVATGGDGGNVAERARLGARIAGVVLTTLGVAFFRGAFLDLGL